MLVDRPMGAAGPAVPPFFGGRPCDLPGRCADPARSFSASDM